MKYLASLASLALPFLFACGSGSGVDSSKYLDELTADEAASLCEYYLDKTGTEAKTCGAITFTPRTQEQCVADARPHCTVELLETCADALGDDTCELFTKEECAPYFACANQAE